MLYQLDNEKPTISDTTYIAPGAHVIGNVVCHPQSSIWFNVVVRADCDRIEIGAQSNIQDGCVLHVARKTLPLEIGDEVTVGHNVTLHACTIGSQCLIGMGAIVMDGSEIGEHSIVGAGSLVTSQTKIPPKSLVLRSPAKVKRELTEEEIRGIRESAANYVGDIETYLD